MPWLFIMLACVFAGLAFVTDSPGILGLAIVLALLFSFLALLGFARLRIETRSRSETTLLGPQELKFLRDRQDPEKAKARFGNAARNITDESN